MAVVFTACTKPYGLAPPTVTDTSQTSINLVWVPPTTDGGCDLIGYELFLDDGLGGPFVNTDSSDIMNKPYLLSYQIVLPVSQTGFNFRLYIRALNQIGYADSSIVSVILADVP